MQQIIPALSDLAVHLLKVLCRLLNRWAFSFERTNLHLTVRRKESLHSTNLRELYDAKDRSGIVLCRFTYCIEHPWV